MSCTPFRPCGVHSSVEGDHLRAKALARHLVRPLTTAILGTTQGFPALGTLIWQGLYRHMTPFPMGNPIRQGVMQPLPYLPALGSRMR